MTYPLRKTAVSMQKNRNTRTSSEPLLIQSERAMIHHARELVILADESKFGKIGDLALRPVEKASRIISTKEALEEKGCGKKGWRLSWSKAAKARASIYGR